MPVTLTDVDSFDDVTAPAGTDVRNAASIQASMQTAANRTRNLKNRVDAAEASIATEAVARIYADALREPGGRLSASSTAQFADVTSVSTLYYAPWKSGLIGLYDGTAWKLVVFSSPVSLALSGMVAGSNYDVFAYFDGTNVQLELGPAWTTDTTGGGVAACARQDGVLVKSGDPTRRYLGTIRATGATTTTDRESKRFIWNFYNRVVRDLRVLASASWIYSTSAWRQANASSANQVEFVQGEENVVDARVLALCTGSMTNTNMAMGIGIDSTTSNAAQTYGSFGVTSVTAGVGSQQSAAELRAPIGAGYHKLCWLEYAGPGATTVQGNTTAWSSGMTARVEG